MRDRSTVPFYWANGAADLKAARDSWLITLPVGGERCRHLPGIAALERGVA